jgi:hypothetical protein
MRGVTVAQSPATARVNRVIGRKVVTTLNALLEEVTPASWRGAPQAARARAREKAPARDIKVFMGLIGKGRLGDGKEPDRQQTWP